MAIYTLYRGQLKYTERMYAGAFRDLPSKKKFLEFLNSKSIMSNNPILYRLISLILSCSEDDFSAFIDDFFSNSDFVEIGNEYKLFLLSDYLAIRKSVKDILLDFLCGNEKSKVAFSEDAIEAVAQHYGVYRTGFLDVTWNEGVATWFATHKFTKDGIIGKGRYEPVEKPQWGFLYIIRVDSEKFLAEFPLTDFLVQIDAIDSRLIRIERQCAATLSVPWEPVRRAIFPLDLAKIFDIEIIDLKEKYKHKKCRSASDICPFTQEYLFPGTNEDQLYRKLRKSGFHTFPN